MPHVVVSFADGSRWISPNLTEQQAQETKRAVGAAWERRAPLTIGPIRSYGEESSAAVCAFFDEEIQRAITLSAQMAQLPPPAAGPVVHRLHSLARSVNTTISGWAKSAKELQRFADTATKDAVDAHAHLARLANLLQLSDREVGTGTVSERIAGIVRALRSRRATIISPR